MQLRFPFVPPKELSYATANFVKALSWFHFGFPIIPVLPGTKQPAVNPGEWFAGVSKDKIFQYWRQYPKHEVGFQPGNQYVVVVAETDEAKKALSRFQGDFDVWPNLVAATATGGNQSYLKLATGISLDDSQVGDDACVDRIGILTGDTTIVLPSCAGNTLVLIQADDANSLVEVTPKFIAALIDNNRAVFSLPSVVPATALPELEMPPIDDEVVPLPATELPEMKVAKSADGAMDMEVPVSSLNPLAKFSLLGMSGELARRAVAEVPVLGQIALQGQLTAIYSPPNTGKTLLTLSLLIEAIQQGRITPANVYYLNLDDNSSGLHEKLVIAEEYGFHMLAEGYKDFNANQFCDAVVEMIRNDQVAGVIIILDTLKRVVDIMDKTKASRFTKVIRNFAQMGGTVIALAHTNKNPGKDGRPIYGGVSDIVNDIDCAFMLTTISSQPDSSERVVEFERFKARGNVVQQAAYIYTAGFGIPYLETLLSVQPYDVQQIQPLKQAAQIRSDAEIIGVVIACISDGIDTKMKLVDAVAKRSACSKRIAIQVIDRYTGSDPAIQRWDFSVGDRGAKVYVVLEPAPQPPDPEAPQS